MKYAFKQAAKIKYDNVRVKRTLQAVPDNCFSSRTKFFSRLHIRVQTCEP